MALSKEIPRTKSSSPVLLKLTNEGMSFGSFTWGYVLDHLLAAGSPLMPATAAAGQIVTFNIMLYS